MDRFQYKNKIAIQHLVKKGLNMIRIWNTKVLFNCWYNLFEESNDNIVAVMDYTIFDSYIKIERIYINSKNNWNAYYENPLCEHDTQELLHSLIYFIKTVAKCMNIEKIVMDTHYELRLYKKFYRFEGFMITNRKTDNPFWYEMVLKWF
jgi:hypothetical protein